jgi:eukaryotic-like serine/threonine-protein kinase
MRLLVSLFAVAILVEAGTGRSAGEPTWPQFGHNPAHTSWNQSERRLSPDTVGKLRLAWSTAPTSSVSAQPTVSGGNVYVTFADGHVGAFRVSDGRRVWRSALAAPSSAAPARLGARLVVLSQSKIQAFAARTGRLLWRTSFNSSGGGYTGSPTVAGGLAYAVYSGLVGVNPSGGALLWRRDDLDCFGCTPAVSQSRLLLGALTDWDQQPNAGWFMYALEPRTGKTIWRTRLPQVALSGGGPAAAGGLVYVRAFSGADVKTHFLYAFDLFTGALRWRAPLGTSRYFSFAVPAVAAGVVYYPSTDGQLYALDTSTGKRRWSVTVGLTDASASVANGVLYIVTGDRELVAFRASDGRRLWGAYTDPPSLRQPDNSAISTPAVVAGSVYVGSRSGRLLAFRLPE